MLIRGALLESLAWTIGIFAWYSRLFTEVFRKVFNYLMIIFLNYRVLNSLIPKVPRQSGIIAPKKLRHNWRFRIEKNHFRNAFRKSCGIIGYSELEKIAFGDAADLSCGIGKSAPSMLQSFWNIPTFLRV